MIAIDPNKLYVVDEQWTLLVSHDKRVVAAWDARHYQVYLVWIADADGASDCALPQHVFDCFMDRASLLGCKGDLWD
jgi:hypothetical protein